MRRIAVINQKGGVGKTTSCCNVGATIAAAGRRVLLIDLDPQAHLTMHLGVEPDGDKPSLYNVLTDNLPLAEAAVPVRDNLTLIPSHIDLAAAEMELVSVMGREVILRDAINRQLAQVTSDHSANGEGYDVVMIDCPPSLGVLTVNGLAAVSEIIVPMQPHFLALQGVGKLLETIGLVRDRINPELSVTGIILCMYEAGTRLAGEVSADLAAFLEQHRGTDVPWADACVYKTIIRRNIKLAECPSHGMTITEYAPSSNGAHDYTAVTAEILNLSETKLAAAIKQSRARLSSTQSYRIKDKEAEERQSAAKAQPVTENMALDAARTEETPTVPPFDTGDRVALGPDQIDPADVTTEEVAVIDEAPVTESTEPQPLPEPPPFAADPSPPVRRSIPVIYVDEPAGAPSGASRD